MNRKKQRGVRSTRSKKVRRRAEEKAAAKAVQDRIAQTEALRREAIEAVARGDERQDR